jgi:cobalt transporter subunit CbtB
MTQLTDNLARTSPLAARLPAALAALALGAVIVYGALFAQLPQLHNAAHDGRHVFTAPCH